MINDNKDDIDLFMFIYKYKYLELDNIKYLFNSEYYYKRQYKYLIDTKYIRKLNNCLVLAGKGVRYLKNAGYLHTRLEYRKEYVLRLKIVSSIAAFFYKSELIRFIPSIDLKDKEQFTTKSRRFIGELDVDSKKYLVYYLSSDHSKNYEKSIYFDIQKEKHYRNVIVLVQDFNMIDISRYYFELNEVLLIEDKSQYKQMLENIHKIDWYSIVQNIYPGTKIYISKFKFADYIVDNSKFVSVLMFVNLEKINAIRVALLEHDINDFCIVCSENIVDIIKQELPNINYILININDHIKEIRIYD